MEKDDQTLARSRIGNFSNAVQRHMDPAPSENDNIIPIIPLSKGERDSLAWRSKVQDASASVYILENNFEVIWASLFETNHSTRKANLQNLRISVQYFIFLKDQLGFEPRRIDELNIALTSLFISFLNNQKQQYQKMKLFIRLLKVLGVSHNEIPHNPYKDQRVNDGVLYDEPVVRHAVKVLKEEYSVLIGRMNKLDVALKAINDMQPPDVHQIENWSRPQTGLLVSTKIIGINLHSWDDLNASNAIPNFRNLMRGLTKCPGAPFVTDSGKVDHEIGWSGQVRWFHPFADDIAPLVVLAMIRTGVNYSAIATVKSGQENWCEPYPFNTGGGIDEQYVYMLFRKSRGVAPEDDIEGANIRIPSSMRPYSHCFRIFAFVEKLTAPLRANVHAEISRLEAKRPKSAAEVHQLEKFKRIKDDLFIYRTKTTGVTSLAEHSVTSAPLAVRKCLQRCGLQTNIRHLRPLRLNFAYSASGNNIYVAQLLASHRDPNTTRIYNRRKATLSRVYEQFEDVFALSVSLIRSSKYTYENLKLILESQGLLGLRLDNLMKPDFRSKWGNNCSTPFDPPPAFSSSPSQGQMCSGLNCIDGCPSARWFYDARSIVERQYASLCARRAATGLLSLEGSSLPSQIERCETILASWADRP